ncbi:HypC/HybG/HupF family hydrogenase formation chaperone [Desulfurococcaceae archaeon MEX13E-LK6-19]|nr:HypC/HybG/HupF family hydrogenase formation chaperone [Desulfurococcaceae archaeon MEX13E-LK6-19]
MCLGVPAEVVDVKEENGLRIAKVKMGGVLSDIVIAFGEEVKPGDYVIVHAGIAISKIDESEVKDVIELWRELEEALLSSS